MLLSHGFRPLDPRNFSLKAGFWADLNLAQAETGLLSQWKMILESDRLENFHRASRGESGTHKGFRFNDSDVYKWLEATAYALSHAPNDALLAAANEAILAIGSAQQEDGYLFTYVQLNVPNAKWKNLANMHEMYCAGHLLEAAIAWQQCHGRADLMEIALKFVQNIESVFRPGRRRGSCGHPEIEYALHRLSDLTGEVRYSQLADWMIQSRGQRPSVYEHELMDQEVASLFPAASKLFFKGDQYDGKYAQDHAMIKDHTSIEGHAVRAGYLYTAAAITAQRNGDSELFSALESVWQNTTTKRMYITGGIGSSHQNEGFTSDYDLPNDSAYAETCAAIALAMWGREMFNATGDSMFIETVERAIFNGILSGISASTDHFFYDNPLESTGNHTRSKWFTCPCCPPNVARTIANIASYAYAVREDGIVVHFPVAGVIHVPVNGKETKWEIISDYPRTGTAVIKYVGTQPQKSRLSVRLPDWSEEVTIELARSDDAAEFESGYAVFDRVWNQGDEVLIDYVMQATWVESNPNILGNAGRIALTYGPTLYCAEELTRELAPQLATVLVGEEPLEPTGKALDGSVTFLAPCVRLSLDFPDEAYSALPSTSEFEDELKLVPYRTWANQGPSFMQVWLRRD